MNIIKERITFIYFSSKQRYGSPRITIELTSLGYQISRITVAKYMRELGLRSKLSKKFEVTTNSKHNYLVVENILNRVFRLLIHQKFGLLISPIFKSKQAFYTLQPSLIYMIES